MTFGAAIGATGSGRSARPPATRRERIVDVALDAGVNLFDTADVYSTGAPRRSSAGAGGRPRDVLLATKLHGGRGRGRTISVSPGSTSGASREPPASRHRLRRHPPGARFDGGSLEETSGALDDLVRAGKVREIGCSNYSAWQLMKALAVSDVAASPATRRSRPTTACSPASSSTSSCRSASTRRSGSSSGARSRSGSSRASTGVAGRSRRARGGRAGAARHGRHGAGLRRRRGAARGRRRAWRDAAQVALNWLLARPGVTSVIVGARNEEQLADNLAAVAWKLGSRRSSASTAASARPAPLSVLAPGALQRRADRPRSTAS